MNYYDENANEYFSKTININMNKNILEFLNCLNGKNILDLGCGSGRDSKVMIDKGYFVTSIDSSKELSKKASKYLKQKVINMDMLNINYCDYFDGIYASASIHHLKKEKIIYMFKLLYKSLKDNGILYATNKYGFYEGIKDNRYFTYFNNDIVNDILKNTKFRLIKTYLENDSIGRSNKWQVLILKK